MESARAPKRVLAFQKSATIGDLPTNEVAAEEDLQSEDGVTPRERKNRFSLFGFNKGLKSLRGGVLARRDALNSTPDDVSRDGTAADASRSSSKSDGLCEGKFLTKPSGSSTSLGSSPPKAKLLMDDEDDEFGFRAEEPDWGVPAIEMPKRRQSSLSFQLKQKSFQSKLRFDQDEPGPTETSGDVFEGLLKSLREEHMREVALVRSALDKCEKELLFKVKVSSRISRASGRPGSSRNSRNSAAMSPTGAMSPTAMSPRTSEGSNPGEGRGGGAASRPALGRALEEQGGFSTKTASRSPPRRQHSPPPLLSGSADEGAVNSDSPSQTHHDHQEQQQPTRPSPPPLRPAPPALAPALLTAPALLPALPAEGVEESADSKQLLPPEKEQGDEREGHGGRSAEADLIVRTLEVDSAQEAPGSPGAGGLSAPGSAAEGSTGAGGERQGEVRFQVGITSSQSLTVPDIPGLAMESERSEGYDENGLVTFGASSSMVANLSAVMPLQSEELKGSLSLQLPELKESPSVIVKSMSKRALPRIAGLKSGATKANNGCLKSNFSKKSRDLERSVSLGGSQGRLSHKASVMFDESARESSEERDSCTQGQLKVKPVWEPSQAGMHGLASSASACFGRTPSMCLDGGVDATQEEDETGCLDGLVTHPNSTINFYCDVLSILCICYDIVMIPLGVFPVEESTTTECIHGFTTFFWTLDFIRHFFKGHYAQGNVVMDFAKVARNYLKSWAVLDGCIVCADLAQWVVRFGGEDNNSNISRLLRLLRNIRSVRLLRGVKTAHILKIIEDRIQSEALGVCWTTIKLLIIILFANHLISCVWFWIGKIYSGDTRYMSWHDKYLAVHPDGHTFFYRYLTSFHWAITQFTPASINVQPENSVERLFAICVLLVAFVTMSTFISGLTAAVMQLRRISAVKHKQFWLLRRYLNERGVPTKLAVRVNNYCEHAWSLRDKRLQDKNIDLFMLLSMSLRAELKETIFSPRLTQHAFFMLLNMTAPAAMRFICNTAVTQSELARGDDLFLCGDDAHHMFFVERAKLQYNFFDDSEGEIVKATSWVCETCLWANWVHRGTLTAVADSVTVAVESDSFGRVVRGNPWALKEALAYAKSFTHGINREPQFKLSDLYSSCLIEGLWFRLLKDYSVRKNNSSMGSIVRKRKINMQRDPVNIGRLQAGEFWSGIVDRCGAIFSRSRQSQS